jgi:hypothetical protein
MCQVEHTGDAEHEREAYGTEAVERTDGETVDQDLNREHELSCRHARRACMQILESKAAADG